MAIVSVELETLVSGPDALTIRPPPCASLVIFCTITGSVLSVRHLAAVNPMLKRRHVAC